jgi:hypothetical protein
LIFKILILIFYLAIQVVVEDGELMLAALDEKMAADAVMKRQPQKQGLAPLSQNPRTPDSRRHARMD